METLYKIGISLLGLAVVNGLAVLLLSPWIRSIRRQQEEKKQRALRGY